MCVGISVIVDADMLVQTLPGFHLTSLKNVQLYHLPETVDTESVLSLIHTLNDDASVSGIIVQLPLPKQLDKTTIINAVSDEKDVDGFKSSSEFTPCTPLGILLVLDSLGVSVDGKVCCVIGRGEVGRPMVDFLTKLNATVLWCNSHTKAGDLKRLQDVLNEEHEKGRSILQVSKDIRFDGEERWDLKFKSYDELVSAYRRQGSLPEAVYLQAIENTNVMADMVEPFELDRGTKYPHIYENPDETFRAKVDAAIHNHPYALQNHSAEELKRVVDDEFKVYQATKSIDFMLLQTYLREWEKENGIQCGYGRGSVSGSMIAYLLGITQMDSVRFGLNFFRFMNPSRVTNADIDTDYSGKDRDTIKQFLLRDKMNLPSIQSAEIITFNTIALKGAIRDVCRALYKDKKDVNYIQIANHICKEVEIREEAVRKEYPEVFKYVDIVNGTIVSIGTHPSGVLISDLPIDQTVGLCSIATSDYPVSMINMKELDDLMYVKLDILGLDNIGVINETCKMLGIERLTPDNTDMDDMAVWKSIRDNTTLIFQWESNSAQQYLKRFMFTFPVLTYSLLKRADITPEEAEEMIRTKNYDVFVDKEFARWCSDHNCDWNDSNFFMSSDVGTLTG